MRLVSGGLRIPLRHNRQVQLYTVHCLSPISVFCDVFVTTASRVRKSAAKFYLDKNLAVSENASGSSTDHTLDQFIERGLRTPKRQFQDGNLKLSVVEVEIRRIGGIIKGELREECEADEDEGVATDFIMIDAPDQLPWLVFRFDISVKESLAVPASTEEYIRRRAPRKTLTNQSQAMGRGQPIASSTGSSNKTSRETGYESFRRSKKRRMDGSANVGEDPIYTNLNSDLLLVQQEYQKEEAEERRLLRKLQERLQTKKTRNMELRRLLGETA